MEFLLVFDLSYFHLQTRLKGKVCLSNVIGWITSKTQAVKLIENPFQLFHKKILIVFGIANLYITNFKFHVIFYLTETGLKHYNDIILIKIRPYIQSFQRYSNSPIPFLLKDLSLPAKMDFRINHIFF